MLSNYERIVILPSTTNVWPQDVDDIDEKTHFMASTNRASSMEKPLATREQQQQLQPQPQLQSQQQHQHLQQQQQQPLKCPRCDSSNTKFCYYNNYSLSQPRHFCKACKRYWTRGGTLRNVPVGGGCRKNKRSKRLTPASDSGASSTPSANSNTPPPSVQASIEIGSRSSHLSTLFYGAIPSNPSEISLSYPNLNPSYDLPPHLNALGLGFSSGYENSYRNGFSTENLSSIQDLLAPNSLLSSYNSILGSTSSTTTMPTTMTSLITSSVDQQQKFINGAQKDTRPSSLTNFHPLSTFEELQAVSKGEFGLGMKSVKLEDGQNRLEWNQTFGQNQIAQAGLSDPSSGWSMANSAGPWHDQGSIGSSVPSLI